MKRSVSSSLRGFSRLSYSQKFTVITLVFLIPVIAFIPLISDQLTNINRYGVSELSGTLYLRSLWNFSEQLRDFVAVTQNYSDSKVQLSEVEAVQSRVDASLAEFTKLNDQYGSSLDTSETFDDIRRQWLETKNSVQSADWDTFEARQSDLFKSIAELTSQVGDSSYLILDPSLDTYYLMDAVLIKAPDNQSLLFQTYQVSKESIERGSFSAEDRSQLTVIMGRLEANLNTTIRNIDVAIQNDQTDAIQQIVSPPLETYERQLGLFTNLVNEKLNNPVPVESTISEEEIRELETAYAAVHAADSELYQAASASLELGIQNRINTLRQRLIWLAVIAFISILIAFLIGRSMMQSISQPLTELIGATRLLSTGDMSSRVAVQDPGEIGQVGIAFNQMAEELERDKQALIARSSELVTARIQSEKRTRDLQTINEIARIISGEHSLDMLLPLIARVVSEKLGFYHVGFFLLDNSRTFAVLQAAYNDGGQEMPAQDYRIRIGNAGVIGTAISTGKPQIASDTENNGIFLSNSFLPNTRSEVAIPIRLGGELIGALDIQSLQENAFTFADLEVFEVLSSQLGIAIQNARLYEQNAQALKDTEEAYRRLAGQSWGSTVQQLDVRGYTYDGVSSHPAAAETQPSRRPESLTVPITVRGQVIGNLRLNPLDPNRTWTEDDIAITNAVAERAALALEAARLLDEAQRRASRETFLSEMASKLSTSFQLDSILRDTVEELGQTLKNSTISFQLVNPSAPPNGENSADANGRRKSSE